MKSGWSSYFPCTNCGSQNVTGAGYCGNCGMNLYYNCPDCLAWVDVTYSSCPNCGVKLEWPRGNALREPASAPAVLLLILGIIMLVAGSIYLIVNSSGSVNAVSNKPAGAASPAASSTWPAFNSMQSIIAEQNNPASIDDHDTAGYAGYDYVPASTRDNTADGVVWTIPVTDTTQVTSSSINSSPGRSYLDTVYPTWGHCVGGRCSGNIQ